ncbi:MAG: QcrA and Rieske domain-containing protein [Actinomycetota bacterium]
MSTLAITSTTVVVIVVLIVVDLFALFFALSFLRANRATREPARPDQAPAVGGPKPTTRRDFFRGALLGGLLVFGAEFGMGTIAFLWPNLKGGFGSKIPAGNLNDIKSQIESASGQPVYNGTGRFYLVLWDGTVSATSGANYAAEGVTAGGIMPLYQRCVHLGCRVPWCTSSKWFECPCHGSKYNGAGEYQLGPAPRGMDRFKITIDGETVTVDTSAVVLGPPRGTNTINQPPQGAFCVAPG